MSEQVEGATEAAPSQNHASPSPAEPGRAELNLAQPGLVIEERSAPIATAGKRVHGLIPYDQRSKPLPQLGGATETIKPGALARTDFSELRAVVDHQREGLPLARFPATIRLEHRADGLAWSFSPPASRPDVVEAIERGDIAGSSWSMQVGRDEWHGEERYIHEIAALTDITLVGSTTPAYETRVEYRSAPRITNEPAAEERPEGADMPEHANEQRSSEERRGGLEVEERQVEDRKFDIAAELADFTRDVKRGETRSLSTTISISNPEFSMRFFDLLRPRSVFLAAGSPVISTDSDSLIYPRLASDAVPGWYAEGDTITASDPGFTAGTAVPRKIAVRTEFSNEVAEDSSPELEGVLRNVLAARAATLVDIAAYEGTGVAPQPTGMGNIAGISNINASSLSTGGITWAGSAIALLEGASAPRPYTYVGGTALVRRLREVRVGSGGNTDAFLFPVGTEEIPSLWGARGRIAPHLNGGTAYFYSPSSCYLINRTAQFDIEVDRSRLFHQDMSEMRVKARLDFAFPYPAAIARGTAIPS